MFYKCIFLFALNTWVSLQPLMEGFDSEEAQYAQYKNTSQDQLLAQAVFKVFDKDGSGTMDFIEFMQARRRSGHL